MLPDGKTVLTANMKRVRHLAIATAFFATFQNTGSSFANPVPGVGPTSAVLLAAGDIGQCSLPGAAATAALINVIPGTVLAVGDLAYPKGSPRDFKRCFEPSWGKFKNRILPTPGNHDYLTPAAAGYFEYFGSRAGEYGKGYYSTNIGQWHIVALNSNVDASPDSEQLKWLRKDLTGNALPCVLAFWHHPRFSSGYHGDNATMAAAWEMLYEFGASIAISGHDHNYERFAPLNGKGQIDRARGIRSFIVGTGGSRLLDIGMRGEHSEAWEGATWGVLKLSLRPDSYAWEFVPAANGKYRDSGTGVCVKR